MGWGGFPEPEKAWQESTADWYNFWVNYLMPHYFGGLESGVADISKGLFEQQRPTFEKMIKDYYGGAAGLGQIVPGEGGSTASQGGLENLMANYMAGITSQALGAYQMPYQAWFGGGPTSASELQAYQAASQGVTQGFGSGMNFCCFIFVEADNGILDRIARRYRDEYGTPEQMIGYKFLALGLVPLMRKYRIVKNIIKLTMVKPMIWWGRAFYGENKWGHIFYPVAKGWLKIFEKMGRRLINASYKRCFEHY